MRLTDALFIMSPIEEGLERAELVEKVYTTLISMAPIHRRILIYRRCMDMPYDDVYKMMGGNRKEFGRLHKEAHQEFRERFRTNWPEYCSRV